MNNIYIYPPQVPLNRKIVGNPYTFNMCKFFSKYFVVLNGNVPANRSILDLNSNIFKMDVVVLNWIENIGNRKFGLLQFSFFLFGFFIMKIRKVKIVWILHNIHPHRGETFLSEFIKNLMFKNAFLIVAHSKESLKYGQAKTKKNIAFLHHPSSTAIVTEDVSEKDVCKVYDILIWGTIDSYKGIVEFLEFCTGNKLQYKIKIIGKCKDANYLTRVNSYSSNLINFEDRIVSFEELDVLIQSSKYVLFPYNSSSVSSSGALLDTLSLYGSVIGPNKGAFSDLKDDNLCFTFNEYEDIIEIIKNNSIIQRQVIENFNNQNSWEEFSLKIFDFLKK